ncbi:PAS domain-containing protein [Sneathiella sp.]|jgi:hypothetical protein|uniref:PAS domain-containing protein n=1 Tax=Sneathiella sp. TaxID=1964365 RepID=UPI0039E55019
MVFISFDGVEWGSLEAQEFATYWRSLPSDDNVPFQSDFNPADVRSLLPNIAIYEMQDEATVICRLVGTGLVDYFGWDITDENILDLWEPEDRPDASKVFGSILRAPCGFAGKTIGETESGKKIESLSVGFPAKNSQGQCNRILFQTSNMLDRNHRISREDKLVSLKVIERQFIALD